MESIICAGLAGLLSLSVVWWAARQNQKAMCRMFDGAIKEIADRKYWVYAHHFPNGKVYIGITNQYPCKRWRNGRGYSYNTHFKRALEKYGWNNIRHEIIACGLTKDEACRTEEALIKQYRSNNPEFGYNKSTGGEHGGSGVKVSEETKAKKSAAMRGRNLGVNKGGKSAKARKVEQYTKDGVYVASYGSTTEAAAAIGIDYSCIVRCCQHKNASSGGYIWLYKTDLDYLPEAVKRCDAKKHHTEEHKHHISEGMKRYRARLREEDECRMQ